MFEVRETLIFSDWLESLRDNVGRTRILARILRLRAGNRGDAKSVGEGVSEMRIDHGPGYRVYFVRKGSKMIVLLAGGDKATQAKDIKIAITLAKEL